MTERNPNPSRFSGLKSRMPASLREDIAGRFNQNAAGEPGVTMLEEGLGNLRGLISDIKEDNSVRFTPARRRALGRALEAFFPISVDQECDPISGNGALEELDKILEDGVGVIVIYNHFSLTDPMRVLEALAGESKMFPEVPVVSPIAVHQRRKSVDALTAGANIGRYPVVTKNTSEELRKVNDKRKLFMSYVNAAGTCLSDGGIVLLAPQQERKEFIDTKDVEENPVGILVKALKRKDSSKQAALLPIGLMLGDELHNNNPYYDLKEKNKGINMQIKFGMPEIIGEEMQSVDEYGVGRLIDLTNDLAGLHNGGVNPFIASEVENYIFSFSSS